MLLPFEGGVCSFGRPAVINRMASCKSLVRVYLTMIQLVLVHMQSYNVDMLLDTLLLGTIRRLTEFGSILSFPLSVGGGGRM